MIPIPAFAAQALDNLLGNALGVAPGEDVAVLVEPARERHYDPRLAPWLIAAIEARGAKARIVETAPDADPDDMPESVSLALTTVDHAIFLSRLGDRIRFKDLPGKASRTMCYVLDAADLEAPFARVPYGFQTDAHQAFLNAIAGSRKATLACPAGSALEFDFAGGLDVSRFANFTVLNFPVMIFPALSARAASGTLALTHALTSTYTHPYPDDVQPLDGTVELTIANGAIAAFGGAQGAHVEAFRARGRAFRRRSADRRFLARGHKSRHRLSWQGAGRHPSLGRGRVRQPALRAFPHAGAAPARFAARSSTRRSPSTAANSGATASSCSLQHRKWRRSTNVTASIPRSSPGNPISACRVCGRPRNDQLAPSSRRRAMIWA